MLPTPVFWPGEFHGLYSPWGRKELDVTERLSLSKLEKRSCSSLEMMMACTRLVTVGLKRSKHI